MLLTLAVSVGSTNDVTHYVIIVSLVQSCALALPVFLSIKPSK